MFKTGDYVVRANKGICEVVDVTHIETKGYDPETLYYIMSPILDKGSKLFIPTEVGDQTFRYALSSDEAQDIIERVPDIEEQTITDNKHRENDYKEAIKSNNPERLVSVIKNIYARKKDRLNAGKKSLAVDDRYFKLAEDLLYSELAFAIGCEKDDIPGLIEEKMAAVA